MKFRDYYSALGIDKGATEKEIKQAYRKLARKHHPDVNPDDPSAESRFKELTEAYEVLHDPDTRRKYDELGANWRSYENAPSEATSGRGNFDGGRWAADLRGADPFSDFFQTFFSGSSHERQRPWPPHNTGQTVDQPIDLTLEEAFHGVQRRLIIATGGQSRTIDVRIPRGVDDDSLIRIAGEGGRGTVPGGDLFLRVRVASHHYFRRKGSDLYVSVDVPLTTAVLGGKVKVRTLDGLSLNVKIPSGTQPGQVLRVKNQGMPSVRKITKRGSLYATVAVQLPRRLNNDQREHFKALADLDGPTRSP